jgi:tetratricopeptide (TPR) repeat protein
MAGAGALLRSERLLALTWLGLGALLVALLYVWGVAGGGAERLTEALDGRYQRRLEHAEGLYGDGRFEEAALELELLDRDHPAVSNRYGLDRQRERVLELLARSHAELDRKARATEVAGRLAAFDARNWHNHLVVAEIAEHFGDLDAADAAYALVLQLNPSHLASTTRRIEIAYAAGRYADVPPLYEAYLDAWRAAQVVLVAGDRRAAVDLLVDGRAKTVEALFTAGQDPAAEAGVLALDPAGLALAIERCELECPPRAGEAGGPRSFEVPQSAWTPVAMRPEAAFAGGWVPTGPAGRLEAESQGAACAARARLILRVFKPVPAELWAKVEKSYANTLDAEGLAAARARTLVGAPDAPLAFLD